MPQKTALEVVLNSAVVITAIGGVFTIVLKLVESWLASRQKSKNTLANAVDKASRVYPILWSLLEEFDPKRIAIFQFHNGGHYFSGESIQRMTMTYEVSRSAVRASKADFQSVIISGSYYIGLKDLLDNHKLYYSDVEKMPDSDLRSLLRYYRTNGFYASAIFDKDMKLVAVLTMCFDEAGPLDRDALQGIAVKANVIQNLLTESK